MSDHDTLTCPHCGAHLANVSATSPAECPVCHRAVSVSSVAGKSGGQELPELRASSRHFRAARTAALTVLAISVLLGLLAVFQVGLIRQEGSAGHVELILLAFLGVGAAFVLAYTQFAMNLKSRN